ncbi:hypothetical protein ACFLQ0_03595 [Nitrospinota bacterium]
MKNQEKALLAVREAYALTHRKDVLTDQIVRDAEKEAPWNGRNRKELAFPSSSNPRGTR